MVQNPLEVLIPRSTVRSTTLPLEVFAMETTFYRFPVLALASLLLASVPSALLKLPAQEDGKPTADEIIDAWLAP